MSGIGRSGRDRSMHLFELALDFAKGPLLSGGGVPVKAVMKVLQGRDFQPLLQQLCRTSSPELACRVAGSTRGRSSCPGGQKRLQGSDRPEFLLDL